MLNITDTKTAQIDECQYFKKLDTDTSKSIVVCVKGDVVAVYNDSRTQIEFSRESNSKEFEEQYLKVMIELGLIDCFTKLGFKMSPTVQQMTIAQWNERISKQAKP